MSGSVRYEPSQQGGGNGGLGDIPATDELIPPVSEYDVTDASLK